MRQPNTKENQMLDTNTRRSDFDAFYRSLDDTMRTVFMADAVAQWEGLQDDEPSRTVSLIDCMENVWDLWRELPSHPDARLQGDALAVKAAMIDTDRIAREREYAGR